MKDEKQITAIINYACPACGLVDEDQSEIAIHTRLGDLSNLHNKIVGFGHFCKQCTEYAKQGIIAIIVDESKSDDMKNPYRTGEMVVVKEEACQKMFHVEMFKQVTAKRMFYVDVNVAKQINLL